MTLTLTAATGFKLWNGGIFGFNWSGPAITPGLTGSTGSKAPYTVSADNGSNLDGFGSFTNAWDLRTAGVWRFIEWPGIINVHADGHRAQLQRLHAEQQGPTFCIAHRGLRVDQFRPEPGNGFCRGWPDPAERA
jgi:hypothetical protein